MRSGEGEGMFHPGWIDAAMYDCQRRIRRPKRPHNVRNAVGNRHHAVRLGVLPSAEPVRTRRKVDPARADYPSPSGQGSCKAGIRQGMARVCVKDIDFQTANGTRQSVGRPEIDFTAKGRFNSRQQVAAMVRCDERTPRLSRDRTRMAACGKATDQVTCLLLSATPAGLLVNVKDLHKTAV